MSFFEDTTVTDTVQATIERVDALEAKEQRKMLRLFKQVRQQLQDRLLTIPDGTFTEQQLNSTLVQVNAAISAINRDLKTGMVDSSAILAEEGISDLVKEVQKFSKKFEGSVTALNFDAILRATNADNFLVNKYQSSIDAYTEALRAQITNNIAVSMVSGDTTQRTVSKLVGDVGRFFVGEEWKLERIARTELHGVYNFSKMQGMLDIRDNTLPDLKKTLFHPMDHRTADDSKKLKQENPIIDINEPFVFVWKGKKRVFQAPPDRPGDRSILLPIRESWNN